jgi:hypothetical protein
MVYENETYTTNMTLQQNKWNKVVVMYYGELGLLNENKTPPSCDSFPIFTKNSNVMFGPTPVYKSASPYIIDDLKFKL